MAGKKEKRSFSTIISHELRKSGFTEEQIQSFLKLYSTDEGKKSFWKAAGFPREPSEEIVEKYGSSNQDNPLVLDVKGFFYQMVQRQNELEGRLYGLSASLAKLEGKFNVVAGLVVALIVSIIGLILRAFL